MLITTPHCSVYLSYSAITYRVHPHGLPDSTILEEVLSAIRGHGDANIIARYDMALHSSELQLPQPDRCGCYVVKL